MKSDLSNDIEGACLAITQRLVRLGDDNMPVGIASGFLFEVGENRYLVSAAHSFKKSRWVLETDFVLREDGVTVSIPINGIWQIKQLDFASGKESKLDIAWARIDLEKFQNSINQDARLRGVSTEFIVYRGPTDGPLRLDGEYSYASWNRVTLVGDQYLERDTSTEPTMVFKGIGADGLCIFQPPKHQGDEYYEGASGSPIINETDQIFAILVSGSQDTGELFGYPLLGLKRLIETSEGSELVD
ncbi:hypothetical protein BH09VER1_BH09VER1_26030 [soil metagenome]